MKPLTDTGFLFKGQTGFYKGKVRDVYQFPDRLVMVVTDRISAFDVVLPEGIPHKGQVLNQTAAYFLQATSETVPNWLLSVPDPNVSIGINCRPFPVEMVIRGYLAGHAWREYKAGKRLLCGVSLPDGLRENDPLPEPIITPTTKAEQGHDLDISREELLARNLVAEPDYLQLEAYTRSLYRTGTRMAAERGLILVDTKYEFGKAGDTIYLIDEVHTPDSSRYFYADGYAERQQKGKAQRQLSKEFVRQWLIENGFRGNPGEKVPHMSPEWIEEISGRYIELYETLTGSVFQKPLDGINLQERVQRNIHKSISEG